MCFVLKRTRWSKGRIWTQCKTTITRLNEFWSMTYCWQFQIEKGKTFERLLMNIIMATWKQVVRAVDWIRKVPFVFEDTKNGKFNLNLNDGWIAAFLVVFLSIVISLCSTFNLPKDFLNELSEIYNNVTIWTSIGISCELEIILTTNFLKIPHVQIIRVLSYIQVKISLSVYKNNWTSKRQYQHREWYYVLRIC